MIGLISTGPDRRAVARAARDQASQVGSFEAMSSRTFESTRKARPASLTRQRQQLIRGHPGPGAALEGRDGAVGPIRTRGLGLDEGDHTVDDHELDLGLRQEAVRVPDRLRDGDLPLARNPHAINLTLTGNGITG